MTSSFCCSSPWTFDPPKSPMTSSMRARRTLCAIALAASDSADRIQVKSPVDPGASASPCRMCDCRDVMLGRPVGWEFFMSGMPETLSFPASPRSGNAPKGVVHDVVRVAPPLHPRRGRRSGAVTPAAADAGAAAARAGRRPAGRPGRARRARTSCAASTAAIAPTTTCSTTTSTSGSIPTRSSSPARTRSASGCCRTTRGFSSICTPTCNVDKILLGQTPLKYERELNAVFVDFPETLRSGRDLHDRLPLLRHAAASRAGSAASRSGRTRPAATGSTPPARARARASGGRARISGATSPRAWTSASPIPNDLIDVSNGRFIGKTDLGDGYTRWDWRVHYPINSYNVSLNIGRLRALLGHARRSARSTSTSCRRTSRRPRCSSRRPSR